MPAYYLDTSSLVKRYRIETGTPTVNELFDDKRDDEALLTSYLGSLEVEAVTARLLRGRVLTVPAYRQFVGQFASDVASRLTLYPLTTNILEASAELIRRYALRAPDAIHLESARQIRTASALHTIYTASDRDLLYAARHEGFDVLDPEDTGSLATLRGYRLGRP